MMAESTTALPVIAGEERASALTVEHVLYTVILLIAFGVRFLALAAQPLAPFEAAQAWPAWLAATGGPVANAPSPQSALLYGAQSWLFFIAGGNDLLARLAPALLGVALVGLPWFWRTWIGRVPALVVAAIFALDPWLSAVGRTADGTGLALFFGLLALTALWQWRLQSDVPLGQRSWLRWERTLAVSTALLLASGVQAWSFLPVLLFFFLCFVWPLSARDRETGLRATSLIWFGVALVLGVSGLLARPEAVSAVGASLTGWLAQFSGGAGVGWPALRLVVDQPLLAIFGPLGLIGLFAKRRSGASLRLPLFLSLWLGWGIVLAALAGESPFLLPMIGLPLAIAAACAVGEFASFSMGDVGWLELVVLLAVAVVLLGSGVIWLATLVENSSYDTRLLATAAILLLLTLTMWIAFGFWAGWPVAAKVAGLFFATVLFLVTVRSNWQLNQGGAMMLPSGFFATTTLPEVRLLVSDINTLSIARRGDPHEAEVQVVTTGNTAGAPDPVLGWYLRDMRNLRWTRAPETELPAGSMDQSVLGSAHRPLIVAPLGLEGDRALAGYLGSDYGVTSRWNPVLLPALPEQTENSANGLPAAELQRLRDQQAWTQATRPRLKWLLYRTVQQPPAVQNVTLWATP